jgi:hypothetical protein
MLKTTWALKAGPFFPYYFFYFFQRAFYSLGMTFIKKIPKLLSCSMLEDGGDESDDDEAKIAN